MPRFAALLLSVIAFTASFCKNSGSSSQAPPVNSQGRQEFTAVFGTPTLDGSGADDVWELSDWLPINQVWEGPAIDSTDFSGRYKLAWDENNLYILAEIEDDSLRDIHPDGLDRAEDDDCLEIFVDEDNSGGNHQFNYGAFAYHIALDGRVTDIGPDSTCRFFDNHCLSRRIERGHVSTWEIAVRIYDGNQYKDGDENVPKLLKAGKKMGFALAYNDNDHSNTRENLIGSVLVSGSNKNRAWQDASVFGVLTLQ